ncbi:MAG: DUF6537 domain-containing protein, partial [Nitratireductor sp.]
GAADALIGCDIVVSSSPKASASYRPGMKAAVNLAEMPTGDIVRWRDASLRVDARLAAVTAVTGAENIAALDANRAAEKLFGDTVFANVMMLGFAWQAGLVPVSLEALRQAIVLNGVAVEQNHRALLLGRIAHADPERLAALIAPKPAAPETLDALISRREAFLTDYQDELYATRYRMTVDKVRAAEAGLGSESLTAAVARALFKLMAYKDEYEVARLHTQTGFAERLKDEFDGEFRIVHHLAPPFLPGGKDARGRPLKRTFGPWIRLPFRLLSRLKSLRGTAIDPFGHTAERRMERGLIGWYEHKIDRALGELAPDTRARLADAMALPMQIRGYGPVKEEAAAKVKAEMETMLAG